MWHSLNFVIKGTLLSLVLDEQKREREFYEKHKSEDENKIKDEDKENDMAGRQLCSCRVFLDQC